MPAISADQDELTIESRADVKALLREAFDYKRELIERKDEVQHSTKTLREEINALQKEVEAIEAKHEGYIERREDAISARIEAVKDWAEQHQEEVLADQSGKTWETPFGSVSFTKRRFNFSWIDKEAAIAHLKKIGHADLVRVQEKVYKRDLKKLPDLVKQLDGVEADPEGDEASVELTIG